MLNRRGKAAKCPERPCRAKLAHTTCGFPVPVPHVLQLHEVGGDAAHLSTRLGGLWVLASKALARVTMVLTVLRGLLTLRCTYPRILHADSTLW